MKTAFAILSLLSSVTCCLAQPQQAWVARYNGGFTNQTHTPLAMALDASGNVYVAGTSQNASNVNDYVVLKYTPAGQQLWAARHSSTNGKDFTLKGFALDPQGNSYLTGTGGTAKLDGNGTVDWTAPYAGNDVAVDTNGNVYVTGFSTVQYATVKLDAAGSNQWVRTHANSGPTIEPTESQKVAVDDLGNVFVAGWEVFMWWKISASTNWHHYSQPSVIAYGEAGMALWTNAYMGAHHNWGEIKGLIPDNQGNVYVTGNGDDGYQTAKISAGGLTAWTFVNRFPGVTAIVFGSDGHTYLTGAGFRGPPHFVYATFKLDISGNSVWQKEYSGLMTGEHQANAVALDNLPNVYVTGVSTNATTANDFATLKYDPDGHQLWLVRYNGPANGNDSGSAIAVAPDGSIYVTGLSANESGGADIVLIKYAALTNIQREPDGSIQLQGFGTPGTNYTFQSATNLVNWADLGSALADTNGLFQFTDTNAPLFPYRFYRWYVP